jgi:hypothetical protein
MSAKDVGTAVVAATLAILLGASAAGAQGAAAEPPKWEFEFTPYLWATGVWGDVAVGRAPTANVEATFGDIIENLDFAAMAMFEARRGRWGLILDGIYSKLSAEGPSPVPVFSRTDVELRTGVIEPAVAYRVWENETVSLDVIGGARIWIVDTEMKLSGNGAPPARFEDTQTWADPFIGGRLKVRLAERWSLMVLGDVGGFGIGSDLTWQAFGGVSFDINKTWSLKAGYRALGVDYENGGFKLDVTSHGPVVGIGIRF